MTFIVNAFMWLINFFASGKAKNLVLAPFKLSSTAITVIAISLYVSSVIAFFSLIVTIFNTFHSVLSSFNSLQSHISGSAYGVSLQTLLHVALGFLSASGLSVAFSTSFSLFITLFFSYMSVKLGLMLANAIRKVNKEYQDTLFILGE